MAYVDAHPEMTGPRLGGDYLASINLDMVGENLELLHSRMNITSVPASSPSVLTDVVANMAEMVGRMNVRTPRGSLSLLNYAITPYGGGSDHMMFIDRKIPGVMLGHSDYTHHTSEDTPDKVDPVELERSEIIAAATMLYLSDLTVEQAVDLVYLVGARGAERIGAAARRARALMGDSERVAGASADPWFEVTNTLSQVTMWESEVASSVLHFNDETPVRTAVVSVQEQFAMLEDGLARGLGQEAALLGLEVTGRDRGRRDERIPVRLTRGPLDFSLPADELAEGRAAWYASSDFDLSGNERFELVNFVDGTRSVGAIRDALSAEFRPIRIEVVAQYIEDLVYIGVMEWKR